MLPATASPLLGRLGIHSLDYLREGCPNPVTCRQAAPHSAQELAVFPRRLSALLFSPLRCDTEALAGGSTAMSLEGVTAREKIPTVVTKRDFKRMRLCRLAVPLEIIPFCELTVGTNPTLDLVDCPASHVGFGSCEQYPVSLVQVARDLKVMALLLLHHAGHVVRRLLLHPLLDPRKLLSLRIGQCPTLLGTRPQQGMMVHSLRIRGRESLNSTPCFLGCIIVRYCWYPGLRAAAGPSCGLRRLHDPTTGLLLSSFVGQGLIVLCHHLSYVTIGLLRIAAAFPIGDIRRRCRSWDG